MNLIQMPPGWPEGADLVFEFHLINGSSNNQNLIKGPFFAGELATAGCELL